MLVAQIIILYPSPVALTQHIKISSPPAKLHIQIIDLIVCKNT